jgi:hypothetical protein
MHSSKLLKKVKRLSYTAACSDAVSFNCHADRFCDATSFAHGTIGCGKPTTVLT